MGFLTHSTNYQPVGLVFPLKQVYQLSQEWDSHIYKHLISKIYLTISKPSWMLTQYHSSTAQTQNKYAR